MLKKMSGVGSTWNATWQNYSNREQGADREVEGGLSPLSYSSLIL